MAAMGADINDVLLAMVDKQGPLYDQATDTVGKQQLTKQFGSVFWADVFPEGEQKQRQLYTEFQKAADAGKLNEFFDANPEYKARLSLNNWDDPEGMLRGFLKSSIWDARKNTDELTRREIDEQLGEQFQEAFLDKETRSYDSIDTMTLAQWARAWKGTVPETAPEVPELPITTPEPTVIDMYTTYTEAKKQLFPNSDLLQDMYYGLSENAQTTFLNKYPELAMAWEYEDRVMAANPELIPYLISSKFEGAPQNVIDAAVNYYGERASMFPLDPEPAEYVLRQRQE